MSDLHQDRLTNKLTWGLHQEVPDDAPAAWGCRAIVTQLGHVDVLHDRQDCVGESPDRVRLLAHLNATNVGWADAASALLKSGRMLTRESEVFTLYEDNVVHVVADTRGSAGYLYVAAILKAAS